MGENNTVNHKRDCNECKELDIESKVLDQYRKAFRDDVRTVIREEWGNNQDNTARLDSHDRWLGKLTIRELTIYIIPVMVILMFFYLLIKDFIL